MKYYANTIGIEFVLIPSGEFDMGSPSNEIDRRNDEGPVHHVTIDKNFYMSQHEITQKQWCAVMVINPSEFKSKNLPVDRVSWNDVQQFINRLNKMEDTDKYRLPSEAEWEYAARADTDTKYYFGDDENELHEYAWYNKNSYLMTHKGGLKTPNSFDLYDMYGNMCEWIQDDYYDDYNGAPIDGSALENNNSSFKVGRGGSWASPQRACRSATRFKNRPNTCNDYLGFRLVKDI